MQSAQYPYNNIRERGRGPRARQTAVHLEEREEFDESEIFKKARRGVDLLVQRLYYSAQKQEEQEQQEEEACRVVR